MTESYKAKERYARYRQSEKGKASAKRRSKKFRESGKRLEWERNYRDENRTSVNEHGRKRKLMNPVSVMLATARYRAKRKGLEFSIGKDDIHVPDVCPILGIKLMHSTGKASGNSPSLDRIDNSLGYVKGNVHVVSYRANLLKNDATIDELKRIVEFLEKKQCV